jgi:transposase InsO family protein
VHRGAADAGERLARRHPGPHHLDHHRRPGSVAAPDLVRRNFTASAPGQLHVADFTYVPLAPGGFGYTAFVIDAYAGLIAGWECSLSKEPRSSSGRSARPPPCAAGRAGCRSHITRRAPNSGTLHIGLLGLSKLGHCVARRW